jgi:hypothetical protein
MFEDEKVGEVVVEDQESIKKQGVMREIRVISATKSTKKKYIYKV